MPKEDWKYYHSKILDMDYAYNTVTGEIMTEDKTKYDYDDLEKLIREGMPITKEWHEKIKLKSIFKGEIIE